MLASLHEQAELKHVDSQIYRELYRALSDYAQQHFADEESLLREAGYPELNSQISQHQFFKDELRRVRDKFCAGDMPTTKKTLSFLRDWFLNHILHHDKLYAAHLGPVNSMPAH